MEEEIDNQASQFNITDEFIKEYSSNREVIKFIQIKFNRLSTTSAINLIILLLKGNINITDKEIAPKNTSFYRWNLGKFENDRSLKKSEILDLRDELNKFLRVIGKEIIIYDKHIEPDNKLKTTNDIQTYSINKMTMYNKVRKLVCDEIGNVIFKYDFDKPDMDIDTPKNCDTLQRCLIQVLSMSIKFDYPIRYVYRCPRCGQVNAISAYETASTGCRYDCPGIEFFINPAGESKSKRCLKTLMPDDEISITKTAHYYDIMYDDDNKTKKVNASAIGFVDLEPGFYECAMYKINNPRRIELFHIMDVKPMCSNTFNVPQKIDNENYLFTLQRAFDDFIKQQTGMDIWGLYPIKVALIMQKLFTALDIKLMCNIQVVGDPSTGKSLILKYYGFLLNSFLNLSTNGISVSIPGLRGTKQNITLLGREIKIITLGHLGTYKTIHIDEAGENKELVQNLKTFLLEDNYSYDKAGSAGIFYKRTAQINLSENLDYNWVGQYRGGIKKAYKELNIKIGDEKIPEWDESWDLHLPLYKYTNPYLYKVIKEKRIEAKQKQVWWVDSYDYALHQRFPLYFYLVNDKQNESLMRVVDSNIQRQAISEILHLIKALKSEEINNFFNSLKEYKFSMTDEINFKKVDDILKQYDIVVDSRMNNFYKHVVMISRIVNRRKDINEEDYNLLRWMLEKTHCKLDISDTNDYKITGPPDLSETREIEEKINNAKEFDSLFGISENEF